VAQPLARQPCREWREWRFNDKSGCTIQGYSRSADRTFFYIRQLGIGLDAGGVRGRQPPLVFVTHCHKDHAVDIAYMAQRREGAQIYVPQSSVDSVEAFIKAELELNCQEAFDRSLMNYALGGVKHGDVIAGLGKKQRNWSVQVFKCHHAVECVGYAFSETRSKLKAEYNGMSGKEIGALRRQGIVVTEETTCGRFAYCGDTSIRVFESSPWLLELYPIIIVECTFLTAELEGVDLLERCERDGHICWTQLKDVVVAHPQTTFALIHFSLRYKVSDIHEFFERIADQYPNIVVMVGHHDEGER
jgi:ribonuclease Z